MNGYDQMVLVTGGTGFIGTRVVRSLRCRNIPVRILTSRTFPDGMAGYGCEILSGDVCDPVAVRRAMSGIRRVVHLAAVVSSWSRDWRIVHEVNAEGTRRIAAVALEEGVEGLVHVSSNSAIEYRGTGVRDEKDIVPRRRNLTEYARSKVEAEKAVEEAGRNGLPWVIVYPTRVFGIGKLGDPNAATRALAMRLRGRMPVLPGDGRERANWVLVDDVAEGIVAALMHGRSHDRYILGGENATLREVFAMAEEIAGVSPLSVRIPHAVGRLIASAEDVRAQIFRSRARLTREWYDALFEDTPLSIEKAQRELDYKVTPLREGLVRTIDWLREMKYLDGGKKR